MLWTVALLPQNNWYTQVPDINTQFGALTGRATNIHTVLLKDIHHHKGFEAVFTAWFPSYHPTNSTKHWRTKGVCRSAKQKKNKRTCVWDNIDRILPSTTRSCHEKKVNVTKITWCFSCMALKEAEHVTTCLADGRHLGNHRQIVDNKSNFILLNVSQVVSMPQQSIATDVSCTMCIVLVHQQRC